MSHVERAANNVPKAGVCLTCSRNKKDTGVPRVEWVLQSIIDMIVASRVGIRAFVTPSDMVKDGNCWAEEWRDQAYVLSVIDLAIALEIDWRG